MADLAGDTRDALRTDVAAAADELLASEGVDITGADWERQTVELNEGGN